MGPAAILICIIIDKQLAWVEKSCLQPKQPKGIVPMTTSEATGRIRIAYVPDGEPPKWIREAWVGLELPCYPDAGHDPDRAEGALSGEKLKRNPFGFHVPQDLALEVLEQSRPASAAWWRSQGFPHPGKNFCFSMPEVEVISGVIVRPVMVADDLETGRMELPGR